MKKNGNSRSRRLPLSSSSTSSRRRQRGNAVPPPLQKQLVIRAFLFALCILAACLQIFPSATVLDDGRLEQQHIEELALQPRQNVSWQEFLIRVPVLPSSDQMMDMFPVHFMTDKYSIPKGSSAWWTSRERLLQEGSHEQVRVTRDWLDFSVEDLTMWQSLVIAIMRKEGQALVAQKSWDYVSERQQQDNTRMRVIDMYMNTTLAVIPLCCNGSGGLKEDTSTTTAAEIGASNLAATMASLLQHGVKRIIVVGHSPADAGMATRVFQVLTQTRNMTDQFKTDPWNLHLKTYWVNDQQSELAYVQWNGGDVFTKDNTDSSSIRETILQRVMKGLQHELVGAKVTIGSDQVQPNSIMGSFLGQNHVPTDFDSIYWTPPDQILHARLSAAFAKELSRGGVVLPHALQAIPHAEDLYEISTKPSIFFSDTNHAPVILLGRSETSDACCDIATDVVAALYPCDNDTVDWWTCYTSSNTTAMSRFLDKYDFLSLSPSGTGIVTLAGSPQQGRRCVAEANGRGSC